MSTKTYNQLMGLIVIIGFMVFIGYIITHSQ